MKIKEDNIDNTYLINAKISSVKMAGIEASEVKWKNVDIKSGYIDGGYFSYSLMENVIFENMTIKNTSFKGSALRNVVFRNCVVIDARGIHVFGNSFDYLKLSSITFEKSKIFGMEALYSQLNVTFIDSVIKESNLSGLKMPSSISITNTQSEWLFGDHSFLQSLSIDNSHFKESKFNEVNVGEVSLSKLKGGLPVTGNLGNVKIDRLATDGNYLWEGVFLSDSVIYSLDIQNCNAETEIGLFNTSLIKLMVSSCNVDTLVLLDSAVFNA